jgi:hypothetical protein
VTERADGIQIEPSQRRANRGWFPRNSCVICVEETGDNVEIESGPDMEPEAEAKIESSKKDD